jgi:hypothetical protein
MTLPDTSTSGARLRRTFAVAEFALAAILVVMGADAATAHRYGGDGIGTGLAHIFGPVFILIALGVGYAAAGAWQGTPRWWLRQIAVFAISVALVLVTLIATIEYGS